MAEWDATSRPILTEFQGRVKFENVQEGLTVAKQTDDVTGISTLVVIDAKRRVGSQSKGVRPQLKLIDAKGNEIKQAGSDTPLTITFQIGSIILVKDGQEVAPGDMMARMPMETSKTRDITGGLPRVAELFEARSPKDAGMLAEVTGTVSFGKDTKGKQRLVIKDMDGVSHEYLIPKEKAVMAIDGQVVNKGEAIVDGPADPHDILRLLGVEALTKYVIDEAAGKAPAQYDHVLLGITKASLSTDSFISAASFQETTRVLTEAAIMGKRDNLRGLKENVIVGRLIPAGTGLAYHRLRLANLAADLIDTSVLTPTEEPAVEEITNAA